MEDDEIQLCNLCTDLVSLKKTEAFPLRLLETHRVGEWVSVHEFCLEIGVLVGDVKPELFAAWLPDPSGHAAYAIILFYDDESKWSMAAQYNRARLLAHESSPPLTANVVG
jgi:hypothetical protein